MKLNRLSLLVLTCIVFVQTSEAWRSSKVYYGRPCMNGTADAGLVVCSEALDANLYCSDKQICECKPSEKYSGVLYDEELKACLPTPGPEDDFRCQSDFQCQMSSYGKLSMCNKDDGRCACFVEGGQVQLKNNICFEKYSAEAAARTGGGSGDMPACIDNDAVCKSTSLGNLTRCNQLEGRCECYDTATRGKNDVGVWEGRCYFKRRLGDFCAQDEECRVGHHKNSVCGSAASFLSAEKVCLCPVGVNCDANSGTDAVRNINWSFLVVGVTSSLMKVFVDKIIV